MPRPGKAPPKVVMVVVVVVVVVVAVVVVVVVVVVVSVVVVGLREFAFCNSRRFHAILRPARVDG